MTVRLTALIILSTDASSVPNKTPQCDLYAANGEDNYLNHLVQKLQAPPRTLAATHTIQQLIQNHTHRLSGPLVNKAIISY